MKFPSEKEFGFLEKIHTIAVDLDGTLLNSRASISTLNHYILQSAMDQGKNVIIATGRRFSSALPYALEFKGRVLVVSNNGQVLRSAPDAARISEVYISSSAVSAVTEVAKRAGFTPILHVDYFEEGIDFVSEIPITDPRFHNYANGDLVRSRVVRDCNDHGADRALVVCFLSLDKEELMNLEISLLALPEAIEYRTVITMIPGVSYCLEVLEKGASKWSAICSFLESEMLHSEGVISFGDEKNDLEMLSGCGLGFAMKNAILSLKENSKYHTRYSNDEDGIAMTLLELGVLGFP
ncbi:HAD family hydrolase [Leptospira perolatii]|uniref:HAD family hydrolase n=1 Tax=Leptospira perolatii TaxID=2023191 RepID=A0A2M9ZPE5_9LEPT|nr:HAD hydrolase family protein [Leptospira perolatii]PJZ70754.1 HAD family hydrolase [Leptospira perolatii]PJZ73962.1 HAD family hydrolase [Leptospira perolatii]